MEKYNVYVIDSDCFYHGKSLVAAENAEEANKIIKNFKDQDKDNTFDSWGYCFIDEDDIISDVYSERKGIVMYGISYG